MFYRVSWTIEGLSKKAQVALEAFSEQLFGGLGEHWGAQQRNASLGVVEEQGGYGGVAGVAGVAKVVARTAAAALAATMAAQVCALPSFHRHLMLCLPCGVFRARELLTLKAYHSKQRFYLSLTVAAAHVR